MGNKKCKTKDYQPQEEVLYICKKCKRHANKKSELCKAKKVHDFLEKEKKNAKVKPEKKIKKKKKK